MLVGLPGSGKSTLGNQLNNSGVFIDDISVNGGMSKLKEVIDSGCSRIIVSDVFLCDEIVRGDAIAWLCSNASEYLVDWVYFENAPDKCRANVLRRNKNGDLRKVENLISSLTKRYNIPEGFSVTSVFEGE